MSSDLLTTTKAMTYDNYGQISSRTTDGNTLHYVYDANGNPAGSEYNMADYNRLLFDENGTTGCCSTKTGPTTTTPKDD